MQFECGECGMNARAIVRRTNFKTKVELEMVCEAGCLEPAFRWTQRLLPARRAKTGA